VIEWILFDVGGVLAIDMVVPKLVDLARTHGLPPQALIDQIPRWRPQADRGEISDREFWRAVLQEVGVAPAPQDEEIDPYLTLIDDTFRLARRLTRTHRVGILSNDPVDMARARRDKFGFDDLFDPVLISSELGVIKPDPGIYRIAIERLGIAPGRILFVDNLSQNVAAARAQGMQGIVHTDARSLAASLQRLGVPCG